MADVQLEHGYTKIAHEILEVTMKLKLSPTQFKIIMAVWRYTYGFNRIDHDMSLTFLAEAVGAHKQSVKKDLDKLIEMKIIVITEKSTNIKSRKIAFNKNYDSWELESAKKLTVSQIAYSRVSQITDSGVSQITDQEINYLNKNLNKDTEEGNTLERILDILEKSEILDSKNITAFLREDISDIIDNFGFGDPEEMIVEAIKDTARGNGKTWKYVYKKLVDWKSKGYKTPKDLEKEDTNGKTVPQHRRSNGRSTSQNAKEPFNVFGNKVGRY
ncbi:replication protein [Bacillus sp. BRMEA1]|uniref:replication protein n=1 Tax=Neobacillus endophyticus TaxID=2738405 RepID=UPI001563F642|nr:replication protein [Neobacillus endophyticus]NRD80319.1 replication protein [Neobacillus endophyticus]